ncbi:MAG: hypothetical protein O7C66_05160 [Alphaproteobacteria bacterium]|nr:hypothetical protein [Alphaproteobacteria bacterium]
MTRQIPEARSRRFSPDTGPYDGRPRYRSIVRRFSFLAGALMCMLLLTPLSRIFGAPLSPDETAMIIIGASVCFFLWLNQHSFSTCPICHKGRLWPVDIGSVEDKLGITDHPMFRKNTWTQWYQCRFCGYREWDEEQDPPK